MTTADVTDRKGALLAFKRCASHLRDVQNVLADGGYVGKPFADAVIELIGAEVQIAKHSELHTFVVMPQPWVVERSFAWLEKCRRLWKSWNVSSTPACSSFIWLFSYYCLKGREQTLRVRLTPSPLMAFPALCWSLLANGMPAIFAGLMDELGVCESG